MRIFEQNILDVFDIHFVPIGGYSFLGGIAKLSPLMLAMPHKKLRYEDYMLPFELLYRDFRTLDDKKDEILFCKELITSYCLFLF